ncbi:fibroblast growth factor 6-like [Aulostomus maculatus]
MSVSLLLPGLLLLLTLTVSDQQVEAKKLQPALPTEDQSTRLRVLWKLHVRDAQLKGKGSSPPPGREGVKQKLLLYCRVGIGFHLQILPGGSLGGVHKPTEFCWLQVFAMKRGVVGIRGVKTGLYLCMSGDGVAYAADTFTDDCLLKENLEENHYTTYSSHQGFYLALSHKGELKRGSSVGRHQSCTHFLPRRTP